MMEHQNVDLVNWGVHSTCSPIWPNRPVKIAADGVQALRSERVYRLRIWSFITNTSSCYFSRVRAFTVTRLAHPNVGPISRSMDETRGPPSISWQWWIVLEA